MIRHISMPITAALEQMNKGVNLFEDQYSPERATAILHKMQSDSKEYISGCSNTDDLGRCKCGEPVVRNVSEAAPRPTKGSK